MQPRSTSGLVKLLLIGAGVVLIPIIVLVVLMMGGSSDDGTNPSTQPTTVTTARTGNVTSSMALFYLADYVERSNAPGPHLVAVERAVTWGGDNVGEQIQAVVSALLDGPVATDANMVDGVRSSIPGGVALLGWTLDNTTDVGIATLDFNQALTTLDADASAAAVAQLVYTVTQFPEVDAVLFTVDGAPLSELSGVALAAPQARADNRDLLPLIFPDNPLPGASILPRFQITGIANTFEANLQYRVETTDGAVLAEGFTTATCGTGCWGDFTIDDEYTLAQNSQGFVVLFESSAEDGSPVNVIRIPVTLESSAPGEAFDLEVTAGLPGGARLDGSFVVDPTLELTGTTSATDLTVNGETVEVIDGVFVTTVTLEPGLNEIMMQAGSGLFVSRVTYLPGGEVEFGFVEGYVASDETGIVVLRDGTEYTTQVLLSLDYAQWLTGDEADRAAEEDGVIQPGEGVPNDYYIRNVNDQLRNIPTLVEAPVLLVDIASFMPVVVQRSEWLDLIDVGGTGKYFGAGDPGTPYWFILDADGYIAQIIQQYVP